MVKNTALRNDLLLVLVTVLAAAGWMFSKNALHGIPPLYFLGIRFLIAGAVLGLIGAGQLRQLQGRQWLHAAGMGSLFALALMIWILGLHHSEHVGEGAFISSLGVVLVPVFARFVFREVLPPSTWIALPVAVAGLALLSLDKGLRLENGQVLMLVSAAIFAFHFNLITRVVAHMPALALTAIQLTVVGVASSLVALPFETLPQPIPTATWGWILAAALIASSARFFLQAYAQARVSASHAAVIMVLEPVWASLLAGWFLQESMSPSQLAGCGLIFAALLVNRWRAIANLIKSG
ncbi:MAG TPA: DMT family transporter [Dongiaceae bacterium]|nr:DMT family transporter [Dongiaceae bacterium]